jgi:hypothetical protein
MLQTRLRMLPSFGMSELPATPLFHKDNADAFATTLRVLGELAAE